MVVRPPPFGKTSFRFILWNTAVKPLAGRQEHCFVARIVTAAHLGSVETQNTDEHAAMPDSPVPSVRPRSMFTLYRLRLPGPPSFYYTCFLRRLLLRYPLRAA